MTGLPGIRLVGEQCEIWDKRDEWQAEKKASLEQTPNLCCNHENFIDNNITRKGEMYIGLNQQFFN